jgi:hypothetical protein
VAHAGIQKFPLGPDFLAGIEIMHMAAKGQTRCARRTRASGANQFNEQAT